MFDTADQALWALGKFDADVERLRAAEAQLAEALQDLEDHRGAVRLAKACSAKTAERAESFETLVSEGLSALFGEEYSFKLEHVYEKQALKGLAPKFKTPEGEFDNPQKSFGSAACQTAGVVVAAGMLVLSKGQTAPLLVGDELFSAVSPHLAERAHSFLDAIVEDGGLQCISITHMPVEEGLVFEVYKKNGVSKVVRKK